MDALVPGVDDLCCPSDLRQLPRNIVLGAQTFPAFLKRSKVSGCHHSGAVSGRARHRQRSGDLHLGTVKEAWLIVALERVWVGYWFGGQHLSFGLSVLGMCVQAHLSSEPTAWP